MFWQNKKYFSMAVPPESQSLLTSPPGRDVSMHQVRGGKVKYSQQSLPPGEKRLLVSKILNIYGDHQYTAINYTIFSMLISCANKV